MSLTPDQVRAVTRVGQDVCVIAGPGSGKTRVLVARFRWLVEEQNVAPARILTITFTEKAAYEIRRRLAQEFSGNAALRSELERAPVGTIHAFCTRLLKENAIAANLDPEFSILNDRDASLLLRETIHESLNFYLSAEPERLQALYDHWAALSPVEAFEDLYRAARLDGFVPQSGATDADAAHRDTLFQVLARVHAGFSAGKLARSVVDFDDLEEFSIRLLESSDRLRAEAQMRFEHILMDEVQDTNPLQWRLVELLRTPGCFFAVGDINQAIYGFRHARPDGFRALRQQVEDSGGLIDRLTENFRSRPEILEAANEVTGNLPGIEPLKLAPRRTFSTSASAPVSRFSAGSRSADPEAEAREVARRILAVVGTFQVEKDDAVRPAGFGDIALLFRTTTRFPIFARAFQSTGIPYLQSGGRTLFQRQEIFDLLAWLKLLANPRDEIALATVLRSPFAGVDAAALLSLRQPGTNLWERAQLSNHTAVRDVAERVAQQRRVVGDVPPDRLLAEALDATGYGSGQDAASTANVRRLLEMVAARSASTAEPVASLVQYLEAIEEADAPVVNSTDTVQMLTIHQAKGLEFPIVFLPSLDLAANTRGSGVYYSGETGLGAKWRSDSGEDDYKDPVAAILSERATKERAEESSRLLYVAMTRAEQKLILSAASTQRGWTKAVSKIPLDGQVADAETSAAPPAAGPPPLWVSRPSPAPAHDRSVSASGLAIFQQCPRRYFLECYVGWNSTPSRPKIAFEIEIAGILVSDERVPVDVAAHRAKMEGIIGAWKIAQERQEFPLRESAACRQCPYFGGPCPAALGEGQLELFG